MQLKRKGIGVMLASVLSASLLIGGATRLTVSQADTLDGVTFEAGSTNSTYVVNETLSVPEGTFTYEGKEYAAESIVYTPSGDAFNVNETKLTQAGKYTVEYRAIIEGQLVKEYRDFEAYESLYSVDSGLSSIRYGKPYDLGVNFATEESPAGLCVSLARGDEFTYNSVIDLNDSAKTNKLLSMYVTPQVSKAMDAASMYVKLTDIYDPDNYIIISTYSFSNDAMDSWRCQQAFITTCVPMIGQSYTGHFSTWIGGAYGWRDVIWKSTRISGFNTYMSFYGDNAIGTPYWDGGVGYAGNGINYGRGYVGQNSLDFWLNYQERQLYSNQPEEVFEQALAAGGNLSELVADYDSPAYYGTQWEGFTTGECYLSIYADDYNNSSFNFVVTQIDGMDFTTQEPERTFVDETEPRIDVNYGAYTESTYPQGKVNCAYPVFKATGMDGYDGEVEVKARAYYGYGTPNCYEITCKDTFIPDRTGTFTIVYTAKDRMGNTATKTVPVTVGDSATTLRLNVDTSNVPTTGVASAFIGVPMPEYSGGVGELTCTITATNKATGSRYIAEDGAFRPMEAGEYEVVCEVKDFIGQTESVRYNVTITAAEAIFVNLPQFHKYFISSYSYTLPTLKASSTADGSEVNAQIYVEDNGTRREIVNGIYDVDGEARDVKVIYVAGGNELVFTVPVLSVKSDKGIINGAAYFHGTGFQATSTSSNTTITANAGVKTATATFGNPVLAEGFQATYNVRENEFKELSLYLTDSLNKKERIKFTWKKTSGVIFTMINDKVTTVSTMFDFSGEKDSNFTWNNATASFTDNTTQLSTVVDETYYGEAFKGFTSGKVYVTLEMNEVSGNAALTLKSINNQPIRTVRRDMIGAQLALDGTYVADATTGTVISLKDFVVADVLSPNTSTTITVYDPSGAPVQSNEGVLLQNVSSANGRFTLSKVGVYRVVYLVNDGNTEIEDSYSITVTLENQIEITVQGSVPTTGTVNQAITLPSAICVSAEGEAIGRIAYIDTTGVIRDITETRTFTPTKAGTYVVIYTAYDSSENVRTITYRITVK